MDIKEYNGISPIIKFYKNGNFITYEYNNKLMILNDDNLTILKYMIDIPYKVSFCGIPINIINNVLDKLDNDNVKYFGYREKDSKNDMIVYHAIFTEKVKIKKI